MPRGDKSSYTAKQKRQAEHIEESYENRGVGKNEAERRAWATVNKETGGGLKKKSTIKKNVGSAKKTAAKKMPSRSGGKKKTGGRPSKARS